MTKAHGVNVEAFIKGEMVLHFSRITVTQRCTQTPIVFSGPGHVQLEKRTLRYVIYHSCVADEAKRHMAISFGGRAGELVKENSLFDFEGVDFSGTLWTAEAVDTTGGSYRNEFCVVEGSINALQSRKPVSGELQNSLHHVYIYDTHFPSNRLLNESGLEFVHDHSTVLLHKDESGCDVSVVGGDLSDEIARAIEKSLNVLSGVRLQLGIAEKVWGGHSVVELYSREVEFSNRQLLPPVEIPFNCASDFFGAVFSLLVRFFERDGGVFYDSWNKLNRAWQAGIDSAALNVSVCIEGVLKAYFEDLGTDNDFAAISKQAVPAVMQLEVDERVKNLLRSCLGGTGNFKPKTALRVLSETGKVSQGLAGKWNKLRSETAHAVETGEAREDWQRMVNLTFANIKLFYELLFAIVGYEGARIDYDCLGHPTVLPSAATYESEHSGA